MHREYWFVRGVGVVVVATLTAVPEVLSARNFDLSFSSKARATSTSHQNSGSVTCHCFLQYIMQQVLRIDFQSTEPRVPSFESGKGPTKLEQDASTPVSQLNSSETYLSPGH